MVREIKPGGGSSTVASDYGLQSKKSRVQSPHWDFPPSFTFSLLLFFLLLPFFLYPSCLLRHFNAQTFFYSYGQL